VVRWRASFVVLTFAAACGSPVGSQQRTTNGGATEASHTLARAPIDAAVPDAPPPPKMTCEAGADLTYSPPGEAMTYCARADGVKQGPFQRLFPDGGVEISGTYREDKLDGPWERHYPGGALAEQGQYAAGLKDGHWKQLGPTGALIGEYDMSAGTGVELRYYDDGTLYKETTLKGGVPNGSAKTYAQDGSVLVSEHFSKGKLDGKRESGTKPTMLIEEEYDHGVRIGSRKIWQFWLLHFEENYDRNGRFDGAYTVWRDKKVPRVQGQYAHGHRDGAWIWTDRDNNKEGDGTYDKGKKIGVWNEWFENKLTFTGPYTDGKPDGTFITYDHNGNELGRFDIKDGTGMWTTWNPNAHVSKSKEYLRKGDKDGIYQELVGIRDKVVVEGHYSGGVRWGVWKEWTPDGVLLVERSYKHGKLDGPWKKFVAGKVGSQATYKDGKLEGEYKELRDGKPAVTGQYEHDLKEGTWTTYDASGNAIATVTYKDNVLDGPYHASQAGVVIEGVMAKGRRAGVWTETDKTGKVKPFSYPP
jgi:antitoxin component YwqK of YwqJK toxin-antitoxin module